MSASTVRASSQLYDPARHEPLRPLRWDEGRAREAIERIVSDAHAHFSADAYWPQHPLDRNEGEDSDSVQTSLYYGACGVFWALHYLQAVGAAPASRRPAGEFERLLVRNRAWLGEAATRERASFMMGDTPIRMMALAERPSESVERALDELISGNIDHPSRELMWGSPGTLLAALFLHERTGNAR